MKKIIVGLCVVMMLILAACSDSSKENGFVTEFMPAFESSGIALTPEYVSDGELRLIGADVTKFEACINVFKELGYAYHDTANLEEEKMISMQLWQGKNDSYRISMMLMLDMSDNTGASDYLKISYYEE